MNALRRWRPLLRIAWRDAARHKVRSALVLALIALPVMAVTAADVLYQTATVTGAESLDRRIGGADAQIRVDPWSASVAQWPDPDRGSASVGDQRSGPPPTLAELGRTLGRPMRGIELRSGQVQVDTAKGAAAVDVEEVDLRDPLAAGLYRIDRGRAPIGVDEVVVNSDLADRGAGLGDTLQVSDGPALKVVGVGESTSFWGYPTMVTLPGVVDLPDDGSRAWLVDAGGPITWPEVRSLNAVGAVVLSREVVEHPPPDSEVPAELRNTGGDSSQTLAILGLIVAMVLLEVVLLAGPAFAVGARRQSRTLALMSATGATPPQTRRTVLGSALVLGTVAALGGVVAGIGLAWATQPLLQRLSHEWFGPFDVPWPHLAGIAIFGLVSALLAAVVPAWISSRQDVVAVLAGRRGDRKAGLRSPVAGVLLLGTGIAGSAAGARAHGNGELMIAFSALVAVLGMILLVPLVLVGLATVSARLPLALRFAVRDAARHRTRTVPAVAAVAATVAGVVALGIANASDAKENRETYTPTLRAGDGVVAAYGAQADDWEPIRRALEREIPAATVEPVEGLPEGGSDGSVSLRFRTAEHKNFLYSYGSSLGASVLVADRLPGLPGLDPDQGAVVDRVLTTGGVVVFANERVPGHEVVVSGRHYDGNGRAGAKVEKHTLPAVFVEVPSNVTVPQAVLSPMAARELGLAPATVGMYVTGSTITADQERNADEAVAAIVPYAGLYVERGYQGDDATRILLLILGSLGAVLMLGGTLTTTYLALSDARPDLATLGAVGAAPRTRRAVAGSFAVVVALVGGAVGAAVGFIPGIAVARPLTSSQGVYTAPSEGSGSSGFNADQLPVTGPFLDIPWLLIVALVVALPLVTALVVAATTRPRLPLVARLD